MHSFEAALIKLEGDGATETAKEYRQLLQFVQESAIQFAKQDFELSRALLAGAQLKLNNIRVML